MMPTLTEAARDNEVRCRLDAARTNLDAILEGRCDPEPEVLLAIEDLVHAARVWATRPLPAT